MQTDAALTATLPPSAAPQADLAQAAPSPAGQALALYRAYLGKKGWSDRQGQIDMITAIGGALERGVSIVAEAGTGVGKTVSYTLPVIAHALKNRHKVVISTGTVALQEQLYYKDLPDIKKHSGLKFSYEMAKGRGRYVCTDRLLNQEDQAAMRSWGLLDEDAEEGNVKVLARLKEAFAAGSWDGDRDSWSRTVPDATWRLISTDNAGCYRKVCKEKENCPYWTARNKLDHADVIVANHALVFSDLAAGGGVILPDPGNTLYIFDEFHNVPGTIINFFAYRLGFEESAKGYGRCAADLKRWQDGEEDALIEEILGRLLSNVTRLAQVLADVRSDWDTLVVDEGVHRFANGMLPEALQSRSREVSTVYNEALKDLKRDCGKIEKRFDELERTDVEPQLMLLGGMLSLLEKHDTLWKCYAAVRPLGQPPLAKWISRQGRGVVMHASPVEASKACKKALWDRALAVVGCSATLLYDGKWDRIVAQTGMPADTVRAVVKSPFDYVNAVKFNLADFGFDPSYGNQDQQNAKVAQWLSRTLDWDAGNLVLFTSYASMKAVHGLLGPAEQKKVLVQGDLQKARMLRSHRKAVESGAGSTLFGVASLAEGIDLAGDLVSHVVVTKIAFDVPKDPVVETLCEFIKSQGEDPFLQVTVPDATTRLVQACGRLIRTEQDRGVISILDRRIHTKYYGRQMMNSLPMLVNPQRQISRVG